ncbi:CopG family transcriptional regulator [Liquorilactobacillus satsumensis]
MTSEKVGITISKSTLSILEELAKNNGLTKSAYIALLINQAGKDNGK